MAIVVKNPPAISGDIRDMSSIPGLGRYPGEGHGSPLRYSRLENPVDRGVWRATIHRVAKSWTWLKWLSMCLLTFIEFLKQAPLSCIVTSVQFSCSVMSDSLRPHELQHARPPCLSPTPRFHPNPCPLSQWCHPTISSSVVPFSSCPQSFPASESFQWVSSSHQVAKVLEFQLQH